MVIQKAALIFYIVIVVGLSPSFKMSRDVPSIFARPLQDVCHAPQ